MIMTLFENYVIFDHCFRCKTFELFVLYARHNKAMLLF